MPRTHIYQVQKGDKVLPQFVGTNIELVNHTSVQDALSAGHFENEAAIMAAANRDRNIIANRTVRQELSKLGEGESVTSAIQRAVTKANKVKVGAARVASTPKTAKPKTVVKSTAAASGNKLFEKMEREASFREQMFAALDNRAEYEGWITARKAAAAEGNGATQAATPQASTPAQAQTPKAQPAVKQATRK